MTPPDIGGARAKGELARKQCSLGSDDGEQVPAVQPWLVLDDLEPCGGGALLLAGSHRLVQRYATNLPPEARGGNSVSWGRFMKQDPWLNELRRGGTPERPRRELLDEPHEVDGVEVQAVEISGTAGDVFLSHLHVFHSPSPNTAGRVRQMLTGGIKARQDPAGLPTHGQVVEVISATEAPPVSRELPA